MAAVAEVIASAFASGMSWAGTIEGHPLYCPPPTVAFTGNKVMRILESFIADHPETADKTYALALSAGLRQALALRFPPRFSAWGAAGARRCEVKQERRGRASMFAALRLASSAFSSHDRPGSRALGASRRLRLQLPPYARMAGSFAVLAPGRVKRDGQFGETQSMSP